MYFSISVVAIQATFCSITIGTDMALPFDPRDHDDTMADILSRKEGTSLDSRGHFEGINRLLDNGRHLLPARFLRPGSVSEGEGCRRNVVRIHKRFDRGKLDVFLHPLSVRCSLNCSDH
jgi:hypothetical protein